MSDAQDKRDYQALYEDYLKARNAYEQGKADYQKLTKARAEMNLFARRNGFI